MFRYSIFNTSLGHMGVVASAKGLHMVILPRKSEREVKEFLEGHYALELYRDEKKMEGIARKINSYLNGKVVTFREDLDVGGATPFEMRVWDTVYGIPYGEVRSYAWVAGWKPQRGSGRRPGLEAQPFADHYSLPSGNKQIWCPGWFRGWGRSETQAFEDRREGLVNAG
jgi:hypothetical protein